MAKMTIFCHIGRVLGAAIMLSERPELRLNESTVILRPKSWQEVASDGLSSSAPCVCVRVSIHPPKRVYAARSWAIANKAGASLAIGIKAVMTHMSENFKRRLPELGKIAAFQSCGLTSILPPASYASQRDRRSPNRVRAGVRDQPGNRDQGLADCAEVPPLWAGDLLIETVALFDDSAKDDLTKAARIGEMDAI